jgi:hypothetical protein
MKKNIIIFTMLLSSIAGFSQEKKWAIKLNPLSLAARTLNVQYERAIGETTSLQLGGSLTFAFDRLSINNEKSSSFSFFQITPEFRKYFGREAEAMNGFYVGPYLRVRSGTYSNSDNAEYGFTTWIIGTNIGYERTIGQKFIVDAFAGPFVGGTVNTTNGTNSDDFLRSKTEQRLANNGFGFRFGVAIGLAK